jgi:hypothetical protein
MATSLTVTRYPTATAFLEACAPALLATRAGSANMSLASSYAFSKSEARSEPSSVETLWLSVTLPSAPGAVPSIVSLAVIGTQSGTLSSSYDPRILSTDVVADALRALVEAASSTSFSLRSIVGPRILSEPFASLWASKHELHVLDKPLMNMFLDTIFRSDLLPSSRPIPENVVLERAASTDVDSATEMLRQFSSPGCRPLDEAAARKSIQRFIEFGHLYVARVDGNAKALVAASRHVPGVRAVTKVWTDEDARGMGLAEMLVRYTCER